MKKSFKYIVTVIIGLTCSMTFKPAASAQVITNDPMNLVEKIVDVMNSITREGDFDMGATLNKFKLAKENFDEARSKLENIQKLVKSVSGAVSGGYELYQIYKLADRMVDDLEELDEIQMLYKQNGCVGYSDMIKFAKDDFNSNWKTVSSTAEKTFKNLKSIDRSDPVSFATALAEIRKDLNAAYNYVRQQMEDKVLMTYEAYETENAINANADFTTAVIY